MWQWSWCMLLSRQNLTSTPISCHMLSSQILTRYIMTDSKEQVPITEIWMTNVAQCGKFMQISESILHCMAFRHFPSVTYGGVLILPLPLFTPTPLMIPSSPDTKPSPLQGQCCEVNTARSERSSVSGPRPEPGRRHMTWETQWSTQHTHTVKLQKKITIGQHRHLLARKRSVFGLLVFEL